MVSFLILGFLIGISHALEADHLAAVGALAGSGKSSSKKLAFLGASWGLGHTTTLLVLSSAVLVFGFVLSDSVAAGLEFGVGVMLVLIGVHVFWKIRQSSIHFHIHQHGDGNKHFHAHSHNHNHGHKASAKNVDTKHNHKKEPHHHKHGFSFRAYLVGLIHGAAGSAGIIALTAAATRDVSTALSYVLVFGFGSICGMALLTYAVSWPLRLNENIAGRFFKITQGAIATIAIFIGANVMIENGPVIWGSLRSIL